MTPGNYLKKGLNMKALLLYSSSDGQTHAIMSCIADCLKEELDCHVVDLLQATSVDPRSYQKILIGASIRYGYFHSELNRFINKHLTTLNSTPSAFFAVNLTARKPEKRTPQTNAYLRKFLLATPWQPDLSAVFAGALRYPRYRWFDRIMIQLIMRMTGGETDSSKEYEYTDWEQVKRFAGEFAHLVSKKV
jgi:menaquinone-dependent protoporphyrinogen oxidase